MKITERDVQSVAELANIELTKDERLRMIKDLNSIIEYVDVLNELDTSHVEPLTVSILPQAQTLRDDVLRPGLTHQTAMMNAPQSDGTFFQVPKVIDKSGPERQ
jgi:aspartyl-tRNA(Asn)/glutamyl-tRNA(Gln) amidotransferase subunit C